MSNTIIINLLIKIAILIAFGYLFRKINVITDDLKQGLNSLLIKAILPISIVMSSQNEFSMQAIKNMSIVALITAGYYVIALVVASILAKNLQLSEKGKKIFITMVVFANVGFIGFPIAGELFKTEGILYTVVYNISYQLIFFTYGISLLSGEKKISLSMLYKNPVTIASISSVVLFLIQFKMQSGVASALNTIGDMTVPISMMLIGTNLADVKPKEILSDKYSYLVSLMRMLILPTIMFLVLLLLKLPFGIAGTCAVLTALPCGSLNVIYAEQYNCEPEFASRTVVQTMVFMVLTLPIMILLVNQFMG